MDQQCSLVSVNNCTAGKNNYNDDNIDNNFDNENTTTVNVKSI